MPRPRSERRLRHLVAKLARSPSDDVEAILSELDLHERKVVVAFLDGRLGDRSYDTTNRGDGLVLELSPWLSKRLSRSGGAGETASFTMTPFAMKVLNEVCADLQSKSGASPPTVANPSRSIFGRFKGAVPLRPVR